jgi:hypothetical protein
MLFIEKYKAKCIKGREDFYKYNFYKTFFYTLLSSKNHVKDS